MVIDRDKVVFISGASSGIGKATAELFAKHGFKVYGTSRKITIGTESVTYKSDEEFIKMIHLDICDTSSVEEAVEYVLNKEGRIDILINNAGFGIAGAIEDTSLEEAKQQFETNFFGMHSMCRKVLPIMRKRGDGIIINIGSVASLIPIPYQAFYSAAKAALDSYTEALSIEIGRFGIKSIVIEPGDTKSKFGANRIYVDNAYKNSAYLEYFNNSVKRMEEDENNGPEPEFIAKIIVKNALKTNPPLRVVVGKEYKIFAILKRILPSRLTVFIVSKMYG